MHLKRHPSGVYFFRQAIPKALQAVLGKSEYNYTLETKDPAIAKYLGYILSAQTLVHFKQLKAEMTEEERTKKAKAWLDKVLSKPEEAPEPPSKISKYEFGVGVGPDGQPEYTILNPKNKEDYEIGLIEIERLNKKGVRPVLPATTEKIIERVEVEQQSLQRAVGLGLKKKRLIEAFNEYKTVKGGKEATLKHTIPALEKWVKYMLGIYPKMMVHQVSRDDIKSYREVLLNDFNHKTQKHGIDRDTVNKKLGFIKTFFLYCQQEEYFPDGEIKLPTRGLFFVEEYKDDADKDREKFSIEEIKKIFEPTSFLKWAKKPHYSIACLFALYSGSRQAEITQLDPRSVEFDSVQNVWFIDYTKGLKNYQSKRTVPVHPTLIKLGFLDYLQDLLEVFPDTQTLFPYVLTPEKQVGNAFRNYLIVLGIKNEKKVFHSFRHTCIQAMERVGVREDYKKYYTGHKDNSIHTQIYSDKLHPLKLFSDEISKFDFPIDIEALKYHKGSYTKVLIKEKAKLKSRQRQK